MKHITFTQPMKVEPTLQIRNSRDALIADIANRTNEPNKKLIAKLLAIAGNTAKWTEMDYHALLKKADDPTIRNYTAFVRWSCKITK